MTVNIDGFSFTAVLDIGASISVVSPKICPLRSKTDELLYDLTEQSIKILGKTELSLNIGLNYRTSHAFLVAEVLDFSLLLGADFVRKVKAKIDFANKTISNENFTLPLVPYQNQGYNNSLFLTSKVRNSRIKERRFYNKKLSEQQKSNIGRHEGILKWFNYARKYGFIQQSSGKDIFVHRSGFVHKLSCFSMQEMNQGQPVSFKITAGKNGLSKATNVLLVNKSLNRDENCSCKSSGSFRPKQTLADRAQQVLDDKNVFLDNSAQCIDETSTKQSEPNGYFVFEHNLSKPMLLDNCASRSLISRALLKSNVLDFTRLTAASGNKINISGAVEIELDLGFRSALTQKFIIAELPTVDAILGIDFLNAHGAIINCATNLLRIDDDFTKIIFSHQSSPTMNFFCDEHLLDVDYIDQLAFIEYKQDSSIFCGNGNSKSDCSFSVNNHNINFITNEDHDSNSSLYLCDNIPRVVKRHEEVFTPPSYDNPPKHPFSLPITLTDFKPIRQRARPCSSDQRKILRETFLDLVERNVVVRGSPKNVCPTTIVSKKNGKHRVCVDYTQLNNKTEWINYPLPQMNSLTTTITPRHKWFSVIDLKEAYFSLPLSSTASTLAGIITPDGAFLPKRTQFGLKNAPFKFCELVDHVTHGLKHFVYTYLDDFLIFSETEEEHLEHLEQILLRIKEFGLFVNLEKCEFGKKEVLFLGRQISSNGIKVQEEKIEVLQQQKPPSTLKELRSFLGLVNHYRPHLPHLAEIAAPLTNLLRGPKRVKRSPIPWNDECQQSFENILLGIKNSITLCYDDPELPLILSTDASQQHAGACLEQPVSSDFVQRKPLAFFSKALPKTKTTRSAFNRELCALRMALQYFRHRIRGRRLIIYTDHKSLVQAFQNGTGQHSPLEIAWLDEVHEYFPELRYIKGSNNQVADFLSRPVTTQKVHTVSVIQSQDPLPCSENRISTQLIKDLQDIEQPNANDIKNKNIVITQRQCLTDEGTEVSIIGVICQENDSFRPFVPKQLRAIVFQIFHKPIHSGSEKTIELVARHYYWPSMVEDITHWASHCPKCQRNKITRHNRQRLSNFPHEPGRLNVVHLDLVGPIPNSESHQYIITMRDRNTGYLCSAPLPDKTSDSVIYAIEQNFISKFGIPDCFISDQGREFVNLKFKAFCLHLGIVHRTTNAYHPQAQGAVERIHRIINTSLRSLRNPSLWHLALPYITLQINNEVSGMNAFTPYQFVFGRPGRLPGALMRPVSDDPTEISAENTRAFLTIMISHEQIARPLRDNNPFIQQELLTCSSCWLRNETATSHISPLYTGPYEILSRSEKTYVLAINANPVSVSIDRLKAHKTCNNQDCMIATSSGEDHESSFGADPNDFFVQTREEEEESSEPLNQQSSARSSVARNRRVPKRFDDFVLY